MTAREEIYNFFVAESPLSEAHKEALRVKRGFSDATIDFCKFRSGGTAVAALEEKFRTKFNLNDLLESGVMIDTGEETRLNPMLLDDRIIIPYLNEAGHCHFLRPHKLGFENLQPEIYMELFLKGVAGEIVLTEGEFKAAALHQWGIPGIAVAGIATFSEKHYPRFKKLLEDHKIKKLTIIFDNEIKDDPALKSYKDDPAKRHDTDFYAYYMANRLEKDGFESRVAILPNQWRFEGKVDLDGALAAGKTADEIRRVMFHGRTHTEFLKNRTDEARQVILRKMAQKRRKHLIVKEFGHYSAIRKGRQGGEWHESISNFIIKIVSTNHTPAGMIRDVQFINEFGEKTGTFSLAAEDMSGSDSFKTFCFSKGNYIWRGNTEDLLNIWEAEFLDDDGRHIVELDHIGWIEKEKLWVFGNAAIKEDGAIMTPDRNNVFWMEKTGIKPVPLGVSSGKNEVAEGIPYLAKTHFDISALKKKLEDTIGVNETALCFGWITAVLFMEEVFELYGCFPFLFVTGRRGSGKSTIAEWIMNFFALENAGKIASDTTSVAVQRYLSYYSSLPVFIDEYRNTKTITVKNGLFRNSYNRQTAGKGIKADFGLREAKIRGTLLIAGEETPEDNALLTRCIVVVVSEKNRVVNSFNWFMANRNKFSNFIFETLQKKAELKERFIKVLNEGKAFFVEAGADDRTAVNYAVVAAGYAAAFGEKDLDFAKWITAETKRVREEYQDEQAVQVFLEDLIGLRTRELVDARYWVREGGKIYIYFHGLYGIWSEAFRRSRGIEPFKAASIRDYLKEEPGFIKLNEPKLIKGKLMKCLVFDEAKAPELLQMLTDEAGAPYGPGEEGQGQKRWT